MKHIVVFAVIGLLCVSRVPTAMAGLQEQVDQAADVVAKFQEIPEKGIPERVLRDAKGIAFLTVLKAGFVFSGQGGWGVVVARTAHGWSGPSGIGTGGAGFGFQVGAQVTEFILILNTPEAVAAFSRAVNVKLGVDLSVAAGPVGRDVSAGVMPIAAVYSYSRSQGLFAGVSVEGTVIVTRNDANEEYYGRKIGAADILSGKATPPAGAEKLRRALARYASGEAVRTHVPATHVPATNEPTTMEPESTVPATQEPTTSTEPR